MSTDVQDFISEVLKRWPPPRTWSEEQEDAWSDDVIAEFATEKKPIFDQALSVLKRQTRQYSGTPRIEDVIKAVNLAVKEVGAQRRAGMLKLEDGQTYDADDHAPWALPKWDRAWKGEGVKLAYDLIKTEMGRRAADEGWIRPLWVFIVVERRLPNDKEITADWLDYPRRRGLKAAAKAHDEAMGELARKSDALSKLLFRMGQDIIRDGERLAEVAHGRQVPSRADWFAPISASAINPIKDNPPSKYADENLEEGRGWKGMTA